MNKKILLSAVLLLLSIWSIKAQDKKNVERYFLTGVGGSYATIQDDGISPLVYDGIGAAGSISLWEDYNRNKQITSFQFDINFPDSEISGAQLYTFRYELNYSYFFKKKEEGIDKKWLILPGLTVTHKWAFRQHQSYSNNSLHVETRTSLAPSLYLERPFTIFNRDFVLGATSSLPLITYATRPLYASTKFSASLNKEDAGIFDYLSDGEIVTLGKYFKWKNFFFLRYPFKNGNALQLSYDWSLESYKAVNSMKTGEHSLLITTVLKL